MDGLFSEDGRRDPHSVLRSSGIAGCRYAFVQAVLHDPRFVAPVMPSSADLMFQVASRFMARLPPGRHRTVRAHFSGLFTPRRVERYRAQIAARIDTLIGAMPANGPIDLVAAFTRPVPFQVIADVLGVPADRQTWLSQAMETFGRAAAGQRDHANVELGNAAAADMLSYFEQALADRAEHPREDVLSLLAAEPSNAETRADLKANCIFFILAGHITTTEPTSRHEGWRLLALRAPGGGSGRAGRRSAEAASTDTAAAARRHAHKTRAWAAPQVERHGQVLQDSAAPKVSAWLSRAARRLEPAKPRRRWRKVGGIFMLAAVAGVVAAVVRVCRKPEVTTSAAEADTDELTPAAEMGDGQARNSNGTSADVNQPVRTC